MLCLGGGERKLVEGPLLEKGSVGGVGGVEERCVSFFLAWRGNDVSFTQPLTEAARVGPGAT
jgi:hypothetical protein